MSRTAIVVYPPPDGGPAPGALEGKFLQLVLRGREHLVFAARERHRYHNQILAHFLAEQGIPHRWVSEQRLEVHHPGLALRGGGRFRLDMGARILELWDDSQAYGRFDERGLAARIAAADHPWRALAVRIT